MRRVNGLVTVIRTVAAASAAGTTARHRVFQAAMMSTCASTNSSQRIADRFGISSPSVAHGVAGTMFFSVAASSLEQEVHAKEAPPAEKFLPKDVVLYQYEACPFCNKVKGTFQCQLLRV